MQLIVEDRAEQALRHLRSADAENVVSALERLATTGVEGMLGQNNVYKLANQTEQFYVLRASPQLRVLLRYSPDQESKLIVEDVVSHALLERYFSDRNGE